MRLRLLASFALATITLIGCDSTSVVAPTVNADVEAALATMVDVTRSARLNAAIKRAALNQELTGDSAPRVQLEANEDTFDALFTPKDQERMLEATRVLTEAYPEMLTMTEEENTAFALKLLTRKPDAAPGTPTSMLRTPCTNWCDATSAAAAIAVGTAYTVAVMGCGPAAPLCMGGAFAIMSTSMAAIAVDNAACVAGCNG